MIPPVMFLCTCGSKNGTSFAPRISCKKTSRTTVGVSLGSFACPVLRLLSSHCSHHTPIRVTSITLLFLCIPLPRGSALPPARRHLHYVSFSSFPSSSLLLGLHMIGHVLAFPDHVALLPDLVPILGVDASSSHPPSSFFFFSLFLFIFFYRSCPSPSPRSRALLL